MYPSSAIAALTAVTVSGSTFGDPLTTRDTVARDTPATAATCSKVGEPELFPVTTVPPGRS
jgi:hypothetical protein